MKKAYGFVEVLGLASALVAADTALKAANVELSGLEPAKGAGMHTLKLSGGVGSVKAAVSSILGDPSLKGKVFAHSVIARPSDDTEKMIGGIYDGLRKEKEESVTDPLVVAPEAEEKPKEEAAMEETEVSIEETPEAEAPETKEMKLPDDNEVIKEKLEAVESTVKSEDNEVLLDRQELKPALEPGPEEVPIIKPSITDEKSSKKEAAKEKDKGGKKRIASCNLCLDPECRREKGEPRSKCIHYKEKE